MFHCRISPQYVGDLAAFSDGHQQCYIGMNTVICVDTWSGDSHIVLSTQNWRISVGRSVWVLRSHVGLIGCLKSGAESYVKLSGTIID